jgi:hypothetical protein
MGLFDLIGARNAHGQIYGGGMPHADITHEVLAGAVGFEQAHHLWDQRY